MLFYRKDDRAMRSIYGCHENFLDSLTMPTVTFPKIVRGYFFLIHPVNVRTKCKVRSFTRC